MQRRTGAAVAAGVALLGATIWFAGSGSRHERSPSAGSTPAATVATVGAPPSEAAAPTPEDATLPIEGGDGRAAPKREGESGSAASTGTELVAPTRTRMKRDVALAVRVRRAEQGVADSGGIADASLWIVPESELLLADESDFDPDQFLDDHDFERIKTDEHGDAVLPHGLEESGLLVAKAGGFGVAVAFFDLEAQRGRPLTLTLHPAQRLEGFVVRGWSEEPVANARLCVRPFLSAERETSNAWERMRQLLRGVVLRTGPGGRFVSEALDFQEVTELTAVADGFALHHCGDLVPQTGPRTVHLFDGRKKSGRVRQRDGRGIEGALVSVQVRGWFPFSETARTTSGADGAFELAVCPAGPIELIATRKGFGRRRLRLDLEPFHSPRFDVVLDEEAKLAGSVVDDLGTPLDGALVDVFDDRDRIEVGAMRAQDGGRWWMYWVAADVPLTVTATLAGHRRWRRDALRAPLDDVRIVLPRNGTLTGVVLARAVETDAAARAPVEKFRLRCLPVAASRVEQRHLEAEPRVVADAGGRFELTDLWPGPAELLIEANGFAPARRAVTVVAGATLACEPILLEPAAAITGRVRAENGAACAGATVELALAASDGDWRINEGTAKAACDATGAFTLAAPPRGFALVVTTADGARHPFLELSPSDFPRDLVLAESNAIEGVVRVPWRFADSTCFLWIRRPGTEIGWGLAPDRGGRFRFGGLDPGDWIVELFDGATLFETHQSDGYLGRRVTVHAGETSLVELSSAGRGVLRGRVDARGLTIPLDALNVYVTSDEEAPAPFHARAAVEPSGAFALGALAPGGYRVELAANLRGVAIIAAASAELVLPACEAEVALAVEGGTLEGRVVGPDGAPLAAAVALASADGHALAQVRARDDGGFTFHGVPVGDWVVHSSSPGCADRRAVVHVASVAAPPLELRLERAARLMVLLRGPGDGGRPLADLDVRVFGPGDDGDGVGDGERAPAGRLEFRARSDGAGAAEFLRLPSDELRVVVGDPRQPPGERALRLGAGENATLELHLDHLAVIEASVPMADAGPRARHRVTCIGPLPDRAAAHRRAATDASGRCRFDGLLAGRYLVVADGDPREGASATVDAVADQVVECELAPGSR